MSYRQQFNISNRSDENESQKRQLQMAKESQTLGLDGKLHWPIRIFTPLLYIGTLLVNYFVGFNQNAVVSDRFSLWITPPGYFFTIWAIIYTGILIANIYNLIKNVWNLKTHIFFGMTNIFNIAWTFVFCIGTVLSVNVAAFILIKLTVFIYLTWREMGKIPEDNYTFFTYFNRNAFAFYLGWCIAASNLNFGMILVSWWDTSKEQQMIVFWVIAPLCALAAFGYILWKWGKKGFLSCFCLWFSVAWAFIGAGITSNKCLLGNC